jgi:hypothetical protein
VNSKLSVHSGHPSNHLHVNQINLDGTPSSYRLTNRNKSAINAPLDQISTTSNNTSSMSNNYSNNSGGGGHGNQQLTSDNSKHNATSNNITNIFIYTTYSQSHLFAHSSVFYYLKMQNLIAKNFIDFTLNAPGGSQQNQNLQSPYQSGGKNVRNVYPQPQQFTLNNLSVGHEPARFIEDILAHSRRNSMLPNKENANNNGNTSTNGNYVRQQLSTNSSVQLPTNIAIINRTNEERYLSPDKLIVER